MGNSFRGALIAHGTGNYLGGIGDLSALIYGGSNDYNITRQAYEGAAELLGVDSQYGRSLFYATDIALGAALLLQPTFQNTTKLSFSDFSVPLILEGSRRVPAIKAAPLPATVNDSYQIWSASQGILPEDK
ncbi:MAG: hypothetical protein AAGB12_05995 [Pseudomonadota bacterium]